jgi:putative ABC transport system ATP-binding protein
MAYVLIEVRNLTKVYGMGTIAVRALRGVDVTVKEGEFVAVMGPSGSGKSTLMNILGCLDRPTDGQYWLGGEDVSRLNKTQLAGIRNRQIGFVFQSYNLLARSSALRNVMLPLLYSRHRRRSASEREGLAREALETVGLGDRTDHRPNEMSGGEQQRVAIARSLGSGAQVLLADEPTGNLDKANGDKLIEILGGLAHERGYCVIIVTHDPSIAERSDKVWHMSDGVLTEHQPDP